MDLTPALTWHLFSEIIMSHVVLEDEILAGSILDLQYNGG